MQAIDVSAMMPALVIDGGLSMLGAGGDADAVAMWLRARASCSSRTRQLYGRNSDRLLQWLKELDLTLPEMIVAHVQTHFDALRNPGGDLLILRNEYGKAASQDCDDPHIAEELKEIPA